MRLSVSFSSGCKLVSSFLARQCIDLKYYIIAKWPKWSGRTQTSANSKAINSTSQPPSTKWLSDNQCQLLSIKHCITNLAEQGAHTPPEQHTFEALGDEEFVQSCMAKFEELEQKMVNDADGKIGRLFDHAFEAHITSCMEAGRSSCVLGERIDRWWTGSEKTSCVNCIPVSPCTDEVTCNPWI